MPLQRRMRTCSLENKALFSMLMNRRFSTPRVKIPINKSLSCFVYYSVLIRVSRNIFKCWKPRLVKIITVLFCLSMTLVRRVTFCFTQHSPYSGSACAKVSCKALNLVRISYKQSPDESCKCFNYAFEHKILTVTKYLPISLHNQGSMRCLHLRPKLDSKKSCYR